MAGSRRAWNETSRPEWREHKYGVEANATRVLLGGNGTTPFGEVLAGTILEFVDDDGSAKARPMICQAVAEIADADTFEVADARNIYPGDEVNFAALADGTLALVAAATVLSVDKESTPNVVTLTANVTVGADHAVVLHDAPRQIAGILEDQPTTTELQSGAIVALDRVVAVGRTGVARYGSLVGMDAALAPYLLGSADDGVLGAVAQAFVFPFAFALDSDARTAYL